jgi:hypothetical protein
MRTILFSDGPAMVDLNKQGDEFTVSSMWPGFRQSLH